MTQKKVSGLKRVGKVKPFRGKHDGYGNVLELEKSGGKETHLKSRLEAKKRKKRKKKRRTEGILKERGQQGHERNLRKKQDISS